MFDKNKNLHKISFSCESREQVTTIQSSIITNTQKTLQSHKNYMLIGTNIILTWFDALKHFLLPK